MSAMEPAGPRIENTGDGLRIEFPGRRKWRMVVGPVVVALYMLGWWALERRIDPARVRDLWILFPFYGIWFAFSFWSGNRRYTVILSGESLAIRQELLGIAWTKRYSLAEIHDLHLRYNPVAGDPPKQWELIFDRKKFPYSVPVPMTLPDAQNPKEAIYSRFPQLAPVRPFFWQV